MPTVTYDGQSLAIDGRRIWILGASIEYARTVPELWADRIAAARQAGFNTISTSCPWLVHEPRKGRFLFHGPTDVRHFVELCGKAGMWVLLRPGPFVGTHYDAGGLPSWLLDMPGIRLREANEPFLERSSFYLRKLIAEVADLQVTNGGPILLVQSEHAWLCSNEKQAERYLREVTRYLRENTITVPIINTNDLWQESEGTIDTWRGSDEMLVHLRQLRVVQPDAPRLVSDFSAAGFETWGGPPAEERRPQELMQWLAQVLAAGAQPVVQPFHGGTHFGFLGGRVAGRQDGFVTTSAAAGAPLGETGGRGPSYNAIKRLVTFAGHFSHVFAELDPDYHPAALDLAGFQPASAARGGRRVSVVPLRGSAGHIVFVFADGPGQEATLLLDQGIRMPVSLGDQSVGWYVINVDLRGSGRLDYANLCPFAIVGRSMLVLQGPAKAPAFLSIDGSPLQATVPAGPKPLVLQHKRVTVVICNQEQIDEAYVDDSKVFVGARGLSEGVALPGAHGAPWVIKADGAVERQESVSAARKTGGARTLGLTQWQAAPAAAYVTGESPRFATLDGPQTLTACGAPHGYGWYRIAFQTGSARSRLCHVPESADRAHLYVGGKLSRVIGVGRGADLRPFSLRLPRGEHVIVALLDNLGRFAEGNDLGDRKGLFGHLYEVRPINSAKPKAASAGAVDPFKLRGYIAGRTLGQLSDTEQAIWSFGHPRKTPVLVEIDGATASGTLVVNDVPVAYYAGSSGGCLLRFVLTRETQLKRGRNVIRFAPDSRQTGAVESAMKATKLYECVETLTAGASWAFAKWEPPVAASYRPVSQTAARDLRRVPCWWRAPFVVKDASAPMWIDVSTLSKGQVFVNGNDAGRYFSATVDGRAVGPQRRLYLPAPWLKIDEENELLLFDEHGFAPHRCRIVFSEG